MTERRRPKLKGRDHEREFRKFHACEEVAIERKIKIHTLYPNHL